MINKKEKFSLKDELYNPQKIIGHVKSDHRIQRNYLKGFVGDEINLLRACAAFNLKKWMNNFLSVLYLYKMILLATTLKKIDTRNRPRYADIYLLWFRVW